MLENKKQIPQLLETAKVIVDYVEKHKYDFLIQNPPYENNNSQSKA